MNQPMHSVMSSPKTHPCTASIYRSDLDVMQYWDTQSFGIIVFCTLFLHTPTTPSLKSLYTTWGGLQILSTSFAACNKGQARFCLPANAKHYSEGEEKKQINPWQQKTMHVQLRWLTTKPYKMNFRYNEAQKLIWNFSACTSLCLLYTSCWCCEGLQMLRTVPSMNPQQLRMGAPVDTQTKESFQLMTFQAVTLNLLLEQTGSTNTDKLYDVEVKSC